MKISLQIRYTIAFVGFAVLILVVMVGLARWSFLGGFRDYIDAIERRRLTRIASEMAPFYSETSGWSPDTEARFGESSAYIPPGAPSPLETGFVPRPEPAHLEGGESTERPRRVPHPTALFDVDGKKITGGPVERLPRKQVSVPVVVHGEVVGSIRSAPLRTVKRPFEDAFSRRQFLSSLLAGVACLILSIVVGSLLARRMLAPIHRLVGGVSELTRGNYAVELGESREDELGQLLEDFDLLARTLRNARSDRQRLFADISHELRTPLTVLLAEVDALRDGVRGFDLESLGSLEEELVRLNHLITDLHELSTTELGALSYQFERHDLARIINESVAALPESPLEISTELDSVELSVDRRRIVQLLRNVLMNSLAYTDVPGQIEVALRVDGDDAKLTISDSAPSVELESHARLFEALYRVEASRSRRTAGSGLGLAIAQRIVEAHRGAISARDSRLGGLEVIIPLPLERTS